jgi:hypothetical protein
MVKGGEYKKKFFKLNSIDKRGQRMKKKLLI